MAWAAKIKNYLLNFIQSQLIVSLVAVPILVNWGLSFSVMTFVGNLLFAPILTLFLMLSTLVFFTQLFHIPNHWLIVILDQFAQQWDRVLACGSASWLIEFCRPPLVFLLAIPSVTFVALSLGRFKNAGMRASVLAGVLAASLLGLWFFSLVDMRYAEAPIASESRIVAADASLTTMHQGASISVQALSDDLLRGLEIRNGADGRLIVVDDGFFSRRSSPEKTVEFELKPYLVKKFGKVHIENIIVKRPGMRTLTAAKEVCQVFRVDKVTVPFFKKSLSKSGWRAFFELKRFLEEKGIAFSRESLSVDVKCFQTKHPQKQNHKSQSITED